MSEVLEGEVIVRRVEAHVVVEQAPPITRISLALLTAADPRCLRADGDTVTIADQVVYRVTGWDPIASALVAERVDDPRRVS